MGRGQECLDAYDKGCTAYCCLSPGFANTIVILMPPPLKGAPRNCTLTPIFLRILPLSRGR